MRSKSTTKEKGGFLLVPYGILGDQRLDIYDALVLCVIASYSRAKKYCWGTNGEIAGALGIHSDRVGKSVRRLDKLGLIAIGGNNRERTIKITTDAGKKKAFIAVPWIWLNDERLSLYDCLVYCEIASKSKLSGMCYARSKVLAENLGMSIGQIDKSLRLLEKLGAIIRRGGNRKGGKRRRTITPLGIPEPSDKDTNSYWESQQPLLDESATVVVEVENDDNLHLSLESLMELEEEFYHNIRNKKINHIMPSKDLVSINANLRIEDVKNTSSIPANNAGDIDLFPSLKNISSFINPQTKDISLDEMFPKSEEGRGTVSSSDVRDEVKRGLHALLGNPIHVVSAEL